MDAWRPAIDGPGGVLPDWPGKLTADRPNIPLIIGVNHDEFSSL